MKASVLHLGSDSGDVPALQAFAACLNLLTLSVCINHSNARYNLQCMTVFILPCGKAGSIGFADAMSDAAGVRGLQLYEKSKHPLTPAEIVHVVVQMK